MNLQLSRNMVLSILGNGVYSISQLIVIILLARYGGVAVVGEYSLALAVTTPIVLMSNVALRQVFVADVKNDFSFIDYTTLRIMSATAAFISIYLISMIYYNGILSSLIIIVGLSKSIEALSDIFIALFQKHERFDLISKSLIMRGLFGVLILFIVYVVTGNLIYSMIGVMLTWLFVVILYDYRNVKNILRKENISIFNFKVDNNFSARIKNRCKLFQIALPVGIATALVSVNVNIPRYFIESYNGVVSLGSFTAMAQFVAIGGLVINSVWLAGSSRLAIFASVGKFLEFRKFLINMLIFGLFLGFLGILLVYVFGSDILLLLYGPDFVDNSDMFILIMFVAMMSYLSSLVGSSLISLRLFKLQAIVVFICVFVNILLCRIFIQEFGMIGAVWSWFTSLTLYFIFCSLIVIHKIRINI